MPGNDKSEGDKMLEMWNGSGTTLSAKEVGQHRSSWAASGSWISASEVMSSDRFDYVTADTWASFVQSAASAAGLHLGPNRAVVALQRLFYLYDNWDGHHALAPGRPALEASAQLITRLPTWLPAPDVHASTEGGVLIEWEATDAQLLISISPDGRARVVIDDADGTFEGPLEADADRVSKALGTISQG